jgi:23S rRNA pseudouridine2605 synthase
MKKVFKKAAPKAWNSDKKGDAPFKKAAPKASDFDKRGDAPFKKAAPKASDSDKKGDAPFKKAAYPPKRKTGAATKENPFHRALPKEHRSPFRPPQIENKKGFNPTAKETVDNEVDTDMRLNKYLAHCGIASRRAAAELIQKGTVAVNGVVVKEIGHRVLPTDKVTYEGKPIEPVEDMVYILMNKPKDVITTVSDERGRKTVLDLVGRTVKTRIYPVGRLDRETTGLLLLTNDGDLAQKMSHPSYRIKKIYHVVLNKNLATTDWEKIKAGVELEDGKAEIDNLSLPDGGAKSEVLIELHIGKNRIVRRIFEHLGYEIEKLDRIYYGGLTKKDLPRSHYRVLKPREVIMLKHFTGK